MVSDVTGDCQAKLQAYFAFLDTSHQRWVAFKLEQRAATNAHSHAGSGDALERT